MRTGLSCGTPMTSIPGRRSTGSRCGWCAIGRPGSTARIGPRALYGMAKSRWEIENQGFNDAKNRHALEHVHHHHPASLLINWLLVMFALTLERLFRLRYLRRGRHRPLAAIELLRRF